MPWCWDPQGCLQPGWAGDPSPLQLPDPGKVRKGQFSTETPGQGPCEIVPTCRVGGTQHPEPLWGLRVPLHPCLEWLQPPAWQSGEQGPPSPGPLQTSAGGAACVGRGHFQPRALLCFLHGKKLFPLLSAKLLAIIRQAGGKDSYPSNNAI